MLSRIWNYFAAILALSCLAVGCGQPDLGYISVRNVGTSTIDVAPYTKDRSIALVSAPGLPPGGGCVIGGEVTLPTKLMLRITSSEGQSITREVTLPMAPCREGFSVFGGLLYVDANNNTFCCFQAKSGYDYFDLDATGDVLPVLKSHNKTGAVLHLGPIEIKPGIYISERIAEGGLGVTALPVSDYSEFVKLRWKVGDKSFESDGEEYLLAKSQGFNNPQKVIELVFTKDGVSVK